MDLSSDFLLFIAIVLPMNDVRKPRLLIADDNPGLPLTLQEAIEHRGTYEVVVVQDGGAAIEALREASRGAFDRVLTDGRMPGANGDEVIRVALEELGYAPRQLAIMSTFVGDTEVPDGVTKFSKPSPLKSICAWLDGDLSTQPESELAPPAE